MAKVVKAQSVTEYMAGESNNPAESGVNPYEVASEFESHTGTAGGRPGADLRIRGSKGA